MHVADADRRPPATTSNRRSLLAGVLLSAAVFAGCARTPQPVHFFAEGKPPRLGDWHLVEVRDGRFAPNEGVVPYDLNKIGRAHV